MPLAINSLGMDTHTQTHTDVHTETILINQVYSSLRLAMPGLKSLAVNCFLVPGAYTAGNIAPVV